MNWTAGILAFILIWIPMLIIGYRFYRENQRIDRKYEEEMKQIKKRYGIES